MTHLSAVAEQVTQKARPDLTARNPPSSMQIRESRDAREQIVGVGLTPLWNSDAARSR